MEGTEITISDDTYIISGLILYVLVIPALVYMGVIIIDVLQVGYLSAEAFDLGMNILMLGYTGAALAAIVLAVGAFIEGE